MATYQENDIAFSVADKLFDLTQMLRSADRYLSRAIDEDIKTKDESIAKQAELVADVADEIRDIAHFLRSLAR